MDAMVLISIGGAGTLVSVEGLPNSTPRLGKLYSEYTVALDAAVNLSLISLREYASNIALEADGWKGLHTFAEPDEATLRAAGFIDQP